MTFRGVGMDIFRNKTLLKASFQYKLGETRSNIALNVIYIGLMEINFRRSVLLTLSILAKTYRGLGGGGLKRERGVGGGGGAYNKI